MPTNSPSKATKANEHKPPFGYFSVKRPNNIAITRPHQLNYLTHAIQSLTSHHSTTLQPRNGTALVVSDDEIVTLDSRKASNFVNPTATATRRPSSNANTRKRALTDETRTLTTNGKNIKCSASIHANVPSSEKRRKGLESPGASVSDTLLDFREVVKHPFEDAESSAISSTANGEIGQAKASRAKRAKVTQPVSKQRWTRPIGKSVKIKRRELLLMQVKPPVRLLARPRFVRRVSLGHGMEDHVLGAVKEEAKYFSAILEPTLPGFTKTERFSRKFVPPPDVDTQIAAGLKASAVNRDSKEASYATEEPAFDDDDDEDIKMFKATEAKKTAKYLNTPVVHHGLDQTLPPIHNLQDIFQDMVLNGLQDSKSHQLQAFLNHIQGRQLRVGTMCSGTECPVLALGLINDALTHLGRPNISFIHVLSCEIVPYKQAYIQRNFNPQYLFRDVTELAGETASTAYGSAVEVPKDLDILIAGSSCKDYSGLNNHQKEYGEEGQSLSTFQGVLGYARNYKPRIVLLENVDGAPWKDMSMEFCGAGYATFACKVHTKDFYIPQTRKRGYMIAFHEEFARMASFNLSNIKNEWANALEAYSRRASSPFTDFIYSDDDPMLDQIKRELVISQSLEKPRRKTDWTRCRHRYISFRAAHGLGFRKPVTMWENNGTCKFPDGSWLKWAKGQVERIWDTIDISYNRCVSQRDYDNRYKARVDELSQNIDRDIDTRPWGIIGCVTPSGIPYLTTRGGPITGPELLALQGIPIDKLSLTYETSRQLQDFAGNAMTSTVVGAAMLAAFGVGFKILEPGSRTPAIHTEKRDISLTELANDGTGQPRSEEALPVGPVDAYDFRQLQIYASSTMQLCSCEGRFGRINGPFQYCLCCGHITCITCGQNRLHNYKIIPDLLSQQRRDPSGFERRIRSWLPLQLQFKEFDIPLFSYSCEAADQRTRKKVMQAIQAAFKHVVHLTSIKRTKNWTATYESSHARLDVVFSRKWALLSSSSEHINGNLGEISIECSLYAKAEATESADSPVRTDLSRPIAHLKSKESIFQGAWEIRLPEPAPFTLEIKYLGEKLDSWEARLGLQDKVFKDRQVTQKILLRSSTGSRGGCPGDIPGVYELLPDCDSACGCLYRKLDENEPGSSEKLNPLFFFLDPGPLCNASQDSYVFAQTHHRLPLGHARDILAQVEKGWRTASSESDILHCTTPGTWKTISQTYLHVPKQDDVNIKTSVPSSVPSIQIDVGRCASADFTALVCSFPLRGDQPKQWTGGNAYSIDVVDKPDALRPFTQLIQRAGPRCGFDEWAEIALPSSALELCKTCAPVKPRLVFPTAHSKALAKHVKHKSHKPLLIEDQHQALEFEKKIRTRPSPVIADLHCRKDGTGILKLQLNVSTLVHRAYGKITGLASRWAPVSNIQWRLANDSGFEQLQPFPELSLPSNEEDPLADPPPNWVKNDRLSLRTPQRRSLAWMIKRESKETEPWVEEEIEEARIPSANLRLEAKVECKRHIRGGILADDVGYGKTAIVLALFDNDASDPCGRRCLPTHSTVVDGKINVKATLVMAPPDLLSQWYSEARRFLPPKPLDNYVILCIKSEKDLRALNIKEISEADLILSTWGVFSDWYLEELAYLSHSPQLPKHPGRAFQQWLNNAMQNLGTVVEGAVGCDHQDYRPTWRTLQASNPEKEGSHFKNTTSADTAGIFLRDDAKKMMDSNFKVVHLEERKDAKLEPLLHLFSFRRVVTDEFTYVQGKDLSLLLQLEAPRKWALSGTPCLSNFHEVNEMAMLLGTKLSTDDNDGGVFESQSVLKEKMKNKTLAEEFHFYSYQTRHSPSWYLARHKLCQKFVQKFVRKNPADLSGVEINHHYEVVDLIAAEQATYFELFQILMSQPVKFSGKDKSGSAQNPDPGDKLDRTGRLLDMARASRSPEEALLVCCSTSMSTVNGVEAHDRTAKRVCKAILEEKKHHFSAEAHKLQINLTQVFKLWTLGHKDIPADNPHFYSFIRSVSNNVFGDMAAQEILDRLLNYAQADAKYKVLDIKAISTGASRFPEPAKEVWNEVPAADETNCKARKIKQGAVQATLVESGAEQPNAAPCREELIAEEKGQTEEGNPDLVDLTPRRKFMNEKAAILTNLALCLVEHVRGLRFNSVIEGYVNGGDCPKCSKCGKNQKQGNVILIMGLCGHASCIPCFEAQHAKRKLVDECVALGCAASCSRRSAFRLSDLNTATSHLPRPFGSKIDAVLKLLKDGNRVGRTDHVVIFVQFPRLKAALMEGLEEASVTYLDGSHKHAVEKFKTGQATVCVLDPESVNAAGWNLQIANHVIFLSSLVTETQYKYESICTQAIGRVYRRGQNKAVHVYHFLAAQTIDVNILEERQGRVLVQRGKTYLLLADNEIGEADKKDLAGAPFEGAACGIDD